MLQRQSSSLEMPTLNISISLSVLVYGKIFCPVCKDSSSKQQPIYMCSNFHNQMMLDLKYFEYYYNIEHFYALHITYYVIFQTQPQSKTFFPQHEPSGAQGNNFTFGIIADIRQDIQCLLYVRFTKIINKHKKWSKK